MKIKYSPLLVVYGAIAVSLIFAAYAYVVTSNIATVTVGDYSLTLDPTSQNVEMNENAFFTATLLNAGSPVEGATIDLWKNDVLIDTGTTLADGTCAFTVLMTDPMGTYDFWADFVVP